VVPLEHRQRIIVALDVNTRRQALDWVQRLRGRVGMFKIGSQLFTAEGPSLVREIIALQEQVFLDLKFHDIPNTVSKSVLVAADLGVLMLTLHTSGGQKMMHSAVESLAQRGTKPVPILLGVTLLTSLSDSEIREVGFLESSENQVARLARLAEAAGLDGIVASPLELASLRRQVGRQFKIVTPGIRPADSATDDQQRMATPEAAVAGGADYLVIGRPILSAPDPVAALEQIVTRLSAVES